MKVQKTLSAIIALVTVFSLGLLSGCEAEKLGFKKGMRQGDGEVKEESALQVENGVNSVFCTDIVNSE